MSLPGIVAVFIATAGCFFALGAYYQHHDVVRNIKKLERKNAHAYYIRRKLYGLLGIFGAHTRDSPEEENESEESNILSNILKYGFPSMNDIRVHRDYVMSFDRRNSAINWICERVDSSKDSIASEEELVVARPSIAESVSAPIVCEIAHASLRQTAKGNVDQSEASRVFFLLNIKPFKNEGLNLRIWENLLGYVNELAKCHRTAYVYTGSIYMPTELGTNSWYLKFQATNATMVAVPTHFFKIIIIDPKEGTSAPYAEAYVVPNSPMPNIPDLSVFLSDIRDIENATGLQFFDGLARNFVSTQSDHLGRNL
ncbi:endonuclease G, mitochondrial [Scaptodrosophila lebanonensis]|uniref:Endonuclease G, mitochondrial n=1 Tax=Drosophila lebanonensis TaxID=7225 RepID=A0A6J2U8Z7_DROLE|nr:endonuclease G, mitochondrial [Scaptodrosophila lebanonensis]